MALASLGTLAALGLLNTASTAEAATVTQQSTGPALDIPDNGFAGTLGPGNVASNTITIGPVQPRVIDHLSIDVAINHEFVGDLTIILEGPDGSLVTLLKRPGGAPIYGVGLGSSANLSTDHTITFDDHADSGRIAYTMGAELGYNEIVGDVGNNPDTPRSFVPSSLIAIGGLDAFVGQSIVGDWTLHVGDSAPGGLGTLESWSISAVAVPSPGAATAGLMLMLGLVGAGLVRRPHRRAAA